MRQTAILLLSCLVLSLSSCSGRDDSQPRGQSRAAPAAQKEQEAKPGGKEEALQTLKPFADENGKMGFLDAAGEIAIPARFDGVSEFSEGMAVIHMGSITEANYGYIDTKGNIVVEPQFLWASPFSEGLSSIGTADRQGYIDKTGKMVFQHDYVLAGNFSEGLAAVAVHAEGGGLKWGYIDKTGRLIIKTRFDVAGSFKNGVAAVEQDGKLGHIDKTGKYMEKLPK